MAPRRQNPGHGSYPEVEKAIRSANRYARQYNKLMRESLDQYGSHGSTVSGVGRSHFPASVKSKLRELLKKYNAKQDEAAAEFKFYHPRTDFYRSKRSAHLRDMMVKAGFYGTGRRNPRSTRYAFKSVRGGDYGGASKAQLLKNVRTNLKRIATEKERSHAVEQLQHLKAARMVTSAEFWKLVDVADSALGKAGRKKSNPRNRKLAIELPGTNLYVVGVGSDTNGNGVIRFKTPNGQAFSIQTAGWPDLHKVRSDLFAMAEIPSKDVKAFTQTATDYIKYYGSPAQKKSLRVYKSNPKRRKNGDLNAPHGLSKAEEKRVRAQIQQDLVAAFMRALDEYAPSTIDKNKIGWGSRLLDAYKSSPNAVGFYAVKERYFGGHSASAKARKWLNSVNDSRWDTLIRSAAREAIDRYKARSNPKRRKNALLVLGQRAKHSQSYLDLIRDMLAEKYSGSNYPTVAAAKRARFHILNVHSNSYTVEFDDGRIMPVMAEDIVAANPSRKVASTTSPRRAR